jgi:hypothetical protein
MRRIGGCDMELFKFNFTTDATVLELGEAINRWTSVMWTERYRQAGEFELKGQLSSGLREFLPLGTLISHADTYEVMIVENHEIVEDKTNDPTIVITGRSLDSWLENRIIGVNQARTTPVVADVNLPANYTYVQAVSLINTHIQTPTNANDQLTNVQAQTFLSTTTGPNEIRPIARGPLYPELLKILAVDDLGIKTVRRNTFGVIGSSSQTIFLIFAGVNRSSSVIFSWKSGDLDSAQYLFSNKPLKNSALVQGRFLQAMVDLGPIKYNRRIATVDANDIDGHLTAVPAAGAARDAIVAKMVTRGKQVLKSQQNITIGRTDISNIPQYQYRKDYDIGDLVSLDGNFGQVAIMRIIENVEIEDENGESSHPTLSIPGAES